MRLGVGTLGFCLVTSAVYVMNDFADRQRDPVHPTKRRRPLASGTVPVGVALAWGLLLAFAGLAAVGSVGVRHSGTRGSRWR
jgi:4-hydroxybenzoate polyprenyltransferase